MNQHKARILKSVALGVAGYEIAAITCGWPTISYLSHKYWVVEVTLLTAFAVDVHYLQHQITNPK